MDEVELKNTWGKTVIKHRLEGLCETISIHGNYSITHVDEERERYEHHTVRIEMENCLDLNTERYIYVVEIKIMSKIFDPGIGYITSSKIIAGSWDAGLAFNRIIDFYSMKEARTK